jgi:very-short-patch-repair endonuclease
MQEAVYEPAPVRVRGKPEEVSKPALLWVRGSPVKHDLARRLRRAQTDVERKLWYALRDRRFHAYRFRRQQPVGAYVVDFICFEHRLIIELDGSQHAEPDQLAHDVTRTRYLESEGFRVLRFWNVELNDNFTGVLEVIRLVLESPPHPHSAG